MEVHEPAAAAERRGPQTGCTAAELHRLMVDKGNDRPPMDPVSYILRKFGLVKGLERSVRDLEQSVRELEGARDKLESENSALRAEAAKWTRFTPHGHFY